MDLPLCGLMTLEARGQALALLFIGLCAAATTLAARLMDT